MIAVEENGFFREVTRRICGSLDIDRALWQSFLYLREIIPAEWINLNVFNPEAKTMDTVAHATADGGAPSLSSFRCRQRRLTRSPVRRRRWCWSSID